MAYTDMLLTKIISSQEELEKQLKVVRKEMNYGFSQIDRKVYTILRRAKKGSRKPVKTYVNKKAPKRAKKTRLKQVFNKGARPIGKSPRSYEELMDLLTVRKEASIGVQFLNDLSLLGKSKKKRKVGRGQSRRSMLDAVPLQSRKRKARLVSRLHGKEAGTRWIRETKNKSGKHNKVLNKRPQVTHSGIYEESELI